MSTITTEHTVFIASPGDASLERQAIADVIDEINGSFAPAGHRLRLLSWERQAAPDAGRPQAVVNEQLSHYDIFVAVLWARMGTPTGAYGSGTEEEIELALTQRRSRHDLPVLLYFCTRPFWPRTLADIEQLRRVFEFRERICGQQQAFPWYYRTETEFRDCTRKHLSQHLRRLAENGRPGAQMPVSGMSTADLAISDPEDVDALRGVWPRMDSALKQVFGMAYNEHRALGDGGVATQDLFASMVRLKDPMVRPFLQSIPASALPEPMQDPILATDYIAREKPWLSHCVSTSIRRLARQLPGGHLLTTADVFADIAKHGTGHSVQRLRDHGIHPRHIDQVIASHRLQVVRT